MSARITTLLSCVLLTLGGCAHLVGPDHEKVFTIRVLLDGKEIGRGAGRSRKSAESTAATHALEQIV